MLRFYAIRRKGVSSTCSLAFSKGSRFDIALSKKHHNIIDKNNCKDRKAAVLNHEASSDFTIPIDYYSGW